jgi:hypothetical protein
VTPYGSVDNAGCSIPRRCFWRRLPIVPLVSCAPSRERRERSDFLRFENSAGEFADFHAQRHTYISGIVAGKASVKSAQELARHSTPTLTIGRYSHTRLHDLTAALEALPGVMPPATDTQPQAMAATGTDGAIPPEVSESFSPVNRQCQPGGTCKNVAKRGGWNEACSELDTPAGDGPQVLTLANLDGKRSHVAKRGLKAEGTGLEPATGCPASDFESGV